MGTFTAQILIGQTHPNEGGLADISHTLYLSEGSRPAWILTSADIFHEQEHTTQNITWIPTLENMLEDALVMIGLYVLKDEQLIKMANEYFVDAKQGVIELYSDIHSEHLQQLYQRARDIESSHKMTISIFQGSSISNQLPVLKKYQNDIEVCKSIFTKEYSAWSGQVEEHGELES